MHRLVLDAPLGVRVDHRRPARSLDNRRLNLRLITHSLNIANSRPRKGAKFKGVTRRHNSWQVECAHRYRGSFSTPEAAARAYDKAAIEEYGEFAYLNFPLEKLA